MDNLSPVSPDSAVELQSVKDAIEARRLRRQERLDIIEDYLGFITSKTSGAALLTSGVLELLSPDVIQAVLPEPGGLVGIGFALLAGRKAADFLSKVAEVFKK